MGRQTGYTTVNDDSLNHYFINSKKWWPKGIKCRVLMTWYRIPACTLLFFDYFSSISTPKLNHFGFILEFMSRPGLFWRVSFTTIKWISALQKNSVVFFGLSISNTHRISHSAGKRIFVLFWDNFSVVNFSEITFSIEILNNFFTFSNELKCFVRKELLYHKITPSFLVFLAIYVAILKFSLSCIFYTCFFKIKNFFCLPCSVGKMFFIIKYRNRTSFRTGLLSYSSTWYNFCYLLDWSNLIFLFL